MGSSRGLGGRDDSRSADRVALGRVRPGIRSPRLARYSTRWGDSRAVAPRRAVPTRGAAPQHLGDRAAHGVLEVHRAAAVDTGPRADVPTPGEQLAAASGTGGRRGVAAGRRAAPGRAPAAARPGRPAPPRAPPRARRAPPVGPPPAHLLPPLAPPATSG